MKSKITQSLRVAKMSVAAVCLFLTACSSDDDNNTYVPPTGAPTNDSYVTGKVDGADFSSIIFGTSAASCNRVSFGDGQMITILGSDLSANSITVQLWNVTTTGEIAVNRNTESLLNYSPGSGGVAFATSAECDNAVGSINVTYIDDRKVEGTFNFTGVNTEDCAGGTKTVTQGSFRGTFPQ